MRDSLAVFTVSVSTPDQIQPALRLLSEALERAPAQEIPVNPELPIGAGGRRSLRRYVGIDAEFVQRRGEIGDLPGARSELESSNPESLCSVLTVAVDRHLVFSFYIMHMLDNPTEQTVPQVRYQPAHVSHIQPTNVNSFQCCSKSFCLKVTT